MLGACNTANEVADGGAYPDSGTASDGAVQDDAGCGAKYCCTDDGGIPDGLGCGYCGYNYVGTVVCENVVVACNTEYDNGIRREVVVMSDWANGVGNCVAAYLYPSDGGTDEGGDAQPVSCDPACPSDQRCLSGTCYSDPPPCGTDPNPNCNWDMDQDTCGKNKGWWFCSYLDPTWCHCDCLTNDYQCPCWKESHCEGKCIGDDMYNCKGTIMGYCSQTRAEPSGCRCWMYLGTFSQVCTD